MLAPDYVAFNFMIKAKAMTLVDYLDANGADYATRLNMALAAGQLVENQEFIIKYMQEQGWTS